MIAVFSVLGQPSPDKSAYRHVGFVKFPVTENGVSRALARASTLNNCASLEFIFLEEAEEPDTPSDGLGRSL
jgi:hypothetical protein